MKQSLDKTNEKKLHELLSGELNFHDGEDEYALHNFHPFPAKFPPQLPHKFIMALTAPDDFVLDPMMGSGTTVLEAGLCGRHGIGCDIDPLSILISQIKTADMNMDEVEKHGIRLLDNTRKILNNNGSKLLEGYKADLDEKTVGFIDYWFAFETQTELAALISEINKIENILIKNFFKGIFSGIIITKSGGVSLSFDLAHTRPHRAKIAISKNGEILFGKELIGNGSPRTKMLTKKLRSALTVFEKRFQQNVKNLTGRKTAKTVSEIKYSEARKLDIPDSSIDLIVTSPPYASNAIDYMRAHKFSLVWFGYKIDELSRMRKKYIGGESAQDAEFEQLPCYAENIVSDISAKDRKKGIAIRRYYSEMKQALKEMFRVLKMNSSAIVVVGNSLMRDMDTETGKCIAEIGEHIGFKVIKIGIRDLDRNRRMLPAGRLINPESQIQQRMHQEYVIGFHKQ
ncbi:MAG: DNA methyltransferase [Desulfobacterales bacterium]